MMRMLIIMALAIIIAGCQADCEKAKEQIDDGIAALNYCSEDSDCIVAMFGCPFGCESYINKDADQSAVKAAIAKYESRCSACEYRCIEPLPPVCYQGRCVASSVSKATSAQKTEEIQVTAIVKECPVCDDNNACTRETCGKETDYTCYYEIIKPCCGDNVCDKAEYGNCEDCPSCETAEKCSEAHFDYDKQACVITKESGCCGNGACEIGESCTSCKDDCTCREGSTLDKYPGFLGKSPYVVVGDEAKGTDVFTASNLANALLVSNIKVDTKLASQVGKVSEHDMIILGRPCENKLLAEFLKQSKCEGFLEPGRAVVKLVVKDGNEYVLLAGYSADDTAKASELLKKKGLTGTEVMIDTSGSTAKVIN